MTKVVSFQNSERNPKSSFLSRCLKTGATYCHEALVAFVVFQTSPRGRDWTNAIGGCALCYGPSDGWLTRDVVELEKEWKKARAAIESAGAFGKFSDFDVFEATSPGRKMGRNRAFGLVSKNPDMQWSYEDSTRAPLDKLHRHMGTVETTSNWDFLDDVLAELCKPGSAKGPIKLRRPLDSEGRVKGEEDKNLFSFLPNKHTY